MVLRHRLFGTKSEEIVLFDNHRANIFIHDGYLNIRPTLTAEKITQGKLDFHSGCTPIFNKKKECESIPQSLFTFVTLFNSSKIHTSNAFNFKNGKIEIKAKLPPKGEWLLPYIMLQNYGRTYDENQIRIAFARGNEELFTSYGVHLSSKILYAGIVRGVETNKSSQEHYGNGFHFDTLIWKSSEISMEVDDVKFATRTHNFDELNGFLVLGVSVVGHLQFSDNLPRQNDSPWSNTYDPYEIFGNTLLMASYYGRIIRFCTLTM